MDNTFNTHGGNFAPLDYTRINEGGSHDENPNGGVQMGVDEQGIPNVVEEDEVVYKDFVYSDNITIDEEMIKKHNLPKQLAGMLYSEAADWFVDQVSSNNDPIDNNGLNAGLSRLAEAQEEQKAIQEQRELEEELSQMSPEELAQLEAMLGEQEEQPVMPTYANGGLLRTFADGTPGEIVDETPEERAARVIAEGQATQLQKELEIKARQNAEAEAKRIASHQKKLEGDIKRIGRHIERDEKKALQMESNAGNVHQIHLPAYKESLLKQYKLIDYNKGRYNAAMEEYKALTGSDYTAPVKAEPVVPVAEEVVAPVDTIATTVVAPAKTGVDWSTAKWKKEKGGLMRRYDNGSKLQVPEIYFDPSDFDINDEALPPMEQLRFFDWRSPLGVARKTIPSPSPEVLPTAGMYLEPLTHGINAIHNLSQQPPVYSYDLAAPVQAYSNMALDRVQYMPEDINASLNRVDASNAGLMSSIRNSGLGPSTGQTLLAASALANRNRGDAFAQSRAAQVAGRNAAVTANNQAAQAEANLAFTTNKANVDALNEYARLMAQQGLAVQQANDAAEQLQYTAAAKELEALGQGMYNTARMNFILNQANSNSALNNGVRQTGTSYRKVSKGGLLKKYKK